MCEDKLRRLNALGVDVPCCEEREAEAEYLELLGRFLKGKDFMKLGQAVNRMQWEVAMMTVRRMGQQADRLGIVCYQRSFAGIRQAVSGKDPLQAKQLLAAVIQKRIKLLSMFREICED